MFIFRDCAELKRGQRWVHARITEAGVEGWEWVGRREVKLGETTSWVKHFVYFTLMGEILNFLTPVIKKLHWEMVPQGKSKP